MKSKRTWIWLALALLVIFTGCNGLAKMDYFCTLCATDRTALQLCVPTNRPLITFYSMEMPTHFTSMKRAVEPARCDHAWTFATGKGGGFIKAEGAASRRQTLRDMDSQGLVTSASRIDPYGTVDFMRWVLRTDISGDLVRKHCFDSDQRPVNFDSESSFRAWFEEFRRLHSS